jgi:hypothetical protein
MSAKLVIQNGGVSDMAHSHISNNEQTAVQMGLFSQATLSGCCTSRRNKFEEGHAFF